MVSLITSKKAQRKIADNSKALRLEKGLTQKGLAERSGVSVDTLRKFERQSVISLESFLKLALVLGCIEKLIEATEVTEKEFSSIDDVLDKEKKKKPKRGWRE